MRSRWLALAVAFSMLHGCTDNMQRAAELAAIAEAQMNANDLTNARISIQKAISTRDDVASYYIMLGQIEVQAQKPVNAFNAYSMALDLEADNVETLQNIANLGLQIGRVKEAREAIDRILIIAPASTSALVIKGFLQIDEGQFDDAQETIKRISAINPQDEGGVILASRVDALQGRPQLSLERINKFISEFGETTVINITRLEVYRMLGDGEKMQAVFPAVLKEMGQNFDYRLDYVNLLYRLGQLAEARQEGLAIINDPRTEQSQLNRLVDVWKDQDHAPMTITQAQSLAASGTRIARLTVARFHLDIGKLNMAQLSLAQLIKQETPDAMGLYSRILLEMGKAATANATANRILESDRRNEDALLVRSAENLAIGRVDRAIEDANVVVSDAPQIVMGYVQLAKAYQKKGSAIRARQIYEQAIDAMPQNLQLAALYKQVLRQWGDTARIVSLDREMALAKPSSVAAWRIYAASCANYGDAVCATAASNGLASAQKRLMIDDAPGTPRRRGLFSRITPEEVCSATGGICTAS
jgi:tetratricopeptide (TPR) repeat protein